MKTRAFINLGIGAALLMAASLPAIAQSLEMAKMVGTVFGSGSHNVVVILHGDGGPGRYDNYAAGLAKAAKDTTVITMVRPGFRGKAGRSPGNNGSKDHYTSGNNKKLAQALAAVKKSTGTKNLIVVGHSGGSGQLGTIIGTYGGIVDVAILAACPCDVPSWRVHRRGKNNWTMSQSPHRYAKKVPSSTKVFAITMQRDKNTRPNLAEKYVRIAKSAGANATLVVPPNGSHSWGDYQPHVNALIRQNLR